MVGQWWAVMKRAMLLGTVPMKRAHQNIRVISLVSPQQNSDWRRALQVAYGYKAYIHDREATCDGARLYFLCLCLRTVGLVCL